MLNWRALVAVLMGFITLPLSFIGLSQMDGSINTYKIYFLVRAILCITTTASAFSRVVVQYIEQARGLLFFLLRGQADSARPLP